MKKIVFAVTVLMYCLMVAITSNAQQGIDVPQVVKASFMNNFKNSEFERWVQVKDAYVATFKENDNWRDAYFTEDGEYKGLGKFITVNFLPMFVQKSLTEKYPSSEIEELYQYESTDDGLSYYAVLENDKRELIVQLSPYGDVTFTQKNKIRAIKPAGSDIAISKIK
ncbi:MAG: hypothetical protein ACHQF0_11920 [Chitinophagales bacterium]